jgi:hypothetical protein
MICDMQESDGKRLTLTMKKRLISMLLDRLYPYSDQPLQLQVADTFADVIKTLSSKEVISKDDLQILAHIFNEKLSFFDYRLSMNTQKIMEKLC